MLHESQTDVIYVPMVIRGQFPRLRKSLSETIVKARISCGEIPYTYEKTRLRMRDWMPIIIDGKGDLAQFRYAPDYLRAPRYKKYIPDMMPI